jgi:hypothetical protein
VASGDAIISAWRRAARPLAVLSSAQSTESKLEYAALGPPTGSVAWTACAPTSSMWAILAPDLKWARGSPAQLLTDRSGPGGFRLFVSLSITLDRSMVSMRSAFRPRTVTAIRS